MRARREGALLLALGVLLTACTSTAGDSDPPARGEPATIPPEPTSDRQLARIACENVEPEVLLRIRRGVRLDRSGDIQIVARDPNFVNGGLTHATPFDYTQEVPIFLYGPGYVRPGVYEEPVTLADLAPTTGALLKFPFNAPDGRALDEALLPEAERPLPALVVTLIWDSAGDNVLERWPGSWPYLASLRPAGAWFSEATVGASPSNTPVAHATIGTGAFPMRHGFVDEYVRLGGLIQKPNVNGPGLLTEPTLADLYDRAMGNRPQVGTVATLAAHVMMMSHGAQWGGGDLDVAVTRQDELAETAGAESLRWNMVSWMSPFYEFPPYANDLTPLAEYLDDLDRADGALDGMWRRNEIARLALGFDTPARTPYQQALVESVIDREGFGADDVPDLLYVNYKAIDTIGHLFSADGIEMSDALATQDAALEGFVSFLDETVGRGRWVIVLAADHGTQRDPAVSGAFMIDVDKVEEGIDAIFDDDDDFVALVQKVRPTEIWLNVGELADNGFTLEQVSRWLLELTQAETITGSSVPEPGREDETVFAAALPSSDLSSLPCLPEAIGTAS